MRGTHPNTTYKAYLRLFISEARAMDATHIEEKGKKAAFAAKGTPFTQTLEVAQLAHIERTKKGFIALGQKWPAGEIDEVANRYIEYTIAAEKKKGLVIETITVPIRVKGGTGMNIHINYGFGEQFTGVTTIYENTALPKNKTLTIRLDQPILVPAGQTLHLRILTLVRLQRAPTRQEIHPYRRTTNHRQEVEIVVSNQWSVVSSE